MTDFSELLAFGLISAMLTLTAVGLVMATFMPGMERWNRRFFMGLFSAVIPCMLAGLADLLVWKDPGLATAERIVAFFEYLLMTVPMPMFTAYLLHTAGENWQESRLFRLALLLWSVYFLLLLSAQGTTFLYYVTPDNEFCRGPWHPLLMLPVVTLMLLNLAAVLRRRSKLQPQYYAAFLLYLLPLTGVMFLHTLYYVPLLTFMGVVLSTVIMFGIILYDQIDRYMRQQREISHQRASIMVLEMRPHFIYNAMMSIYYLCAKDTKKAQRVTLDFTTYLRKNFNAIASGDTVPFADELEHTRAYLAVEEVQFEDRLCIAYDTPHKEFRLPPLTLQPLVENAVKHGMDPEAEPLSISIRTRKIPKGSEVIVEDSGTGLDPARSGNEAHTALANIRQRLSLMCGGSLSLAPREGGGTVVRVTIPDY